MSRVYTISVEQISAIHNAMCNIRSMREYFNEKYKDESLEVKGINYIFDTLEPVRKDLMDKRDADDNHMMDLAEQIKREKGFKHTIWSKYDIESFNDNSNVPVGSLLTSYYSNKNCSVTVKGTTWVDLWEAVEELASITRWDDGQVVFSGFGDHVFIEGFYKASETGNTYLVSLGS